METTLLVLLDACKYDSINEKYSPFLYKLSREGTFKKSSSVPGFCQRTPMLTGLYPRTSGHLMKYKLDPTNSPFRWVKNLRVIRILEKTFPFLTRHTIRFLTKRMRGYVDPDPNYIPLNILHLFDVVDNKYPIEKELESLPNVFSLCRRHGKSYLYLFPTFPYSRSDVRLFKSLLTLLKAKDSYDFIMIHPASLDAVGHKYGSDSVEYKRTLFWLDYNLERVYKSLLAHYRSVNALVVSDHGMKRVLGSIDLGQILNQCVSAKCGKDYILFLDSTVGRIWISNPNITNDIVNVLSLIEHGHIVTTAEKIQLGIDPDDRSYGDLLFWLDPSYVISPNFFSISRTLPKGMHGYLEKDDDLYGIFILNTGDLVESISENSISLVDVFPTVISLLDLPVPKTCEGKNVIALNN